METTPPPEVPSGFGLTAGTGGPRVPNEHSPEPALLTPQEAAAILGRDLSELRRWRADNVGPTFHDLGHGVIRYARESVIEAAGGCDRRSVGGL